MWKLAEYRELPDDAKLSIAQEYQQTVEEFEQDLIFQEMSADEKFAVLREQTKKAMELKKQGKYVPPMSDKFCDSSIPTFLDE